MIGCSEKYADFSILDASREFNLNAVILHLNNCADVNQKDRYIGYTPLHYSAWNGDIDIAELLIVKGANLNARDKKNNTPLDVAVKVVLTGTFIAVVIGAVSGYYGGRVDDIVMRITDVFIAIPGLVLALAIIAVTEDTSIEMLMYALIIVGWPGFTRIIRAEALRIRKLPYIEAAKASGASDFRIIFKHVIPNCITSVIVIATMDMGGIVLSLAALGFLGFGGGPDLAEWGKLVSFGQDNVLLGQWWSFFFPGLVIALWALGFYLLGDGIRDILDPKQRN